MTIAWFCVACGFVLLVLVAISAVTPDAKKGAVGNTGKLSPRVLALLVPGEVVLWLLLIAITFAAPAGTMPMDRFDVVAIGAVGIIVSWFVLRSFPAGRSSRPTAPPADAPAAKPVLAQGMARHEAIRPEAAAPSPSTAGPAGPATRREDVIALLQPWFDRHRLAAWTPVTQNGESDANASKFSGTPWLAPSENWPLCGKCGAEMALFVQLDLGAVPGEARERFGGGLLQLFYCTECADAWKAFAPSSLVRIVERASVAPRALEKPEQAIARIASITGWNRFEDHPHDDEFDEHGLEIAIDSDLTPPLQHIVSTDPPFEGDVAIDEDAFMALFARIGDKLGGWPNWVQGPEYPSCPTCGARMQMLFQLESEEHLDYMFGDKGTGHVTQCPVHRNVVAFGWACT